MKKQYKNERCDCGNLATVKMHGFVYQCERCWKANNLANKELDRFIAWQRADYETIRRTETSRRSKQRALERTLHD